MARRSKSRRPGYRCQSWGYRRRGRRRQRYCKGGWVRTTRARPARSARRPPAKWLKKAPRGAVQRGNLRDIARGRTKVSAAVRKWLKQTRPAIEKELGVSINCTVTPRKRRSRRH